VSNLIVNVGSNVCIEKTTDETKELLKQRIAELSNHRSELMTELEMQALQAEKLETELTNCLNDNVRISKKGFQEIVKKFSKAAEKPKEEIIAEPIPEEPKEEEIKKPIEEKKPKVVLEEKPKAVIEGKKPTAEKKVEEKPQRVEEKSQLLN